MTWTIWVTWVAIGGSSRSHLLTVIYLDVTWIQIDHMFCKKTLATYKWVSLESHECTEPCIIALKPAYYIQLFWSMWCPKISFSRILCMRPVLYPAKNEEICDMVSYLLFYITLKNFSMWVTSGLYQDCSVD